jgi:signal transduction histidine kinase
MPLAEETPQLSDQPSAGLKTAIDRMLGEERRLATQAASVVRLVSAMGILGIIFASFGTSKSDIWAQAMIPVAIYVVSALGFFLIRNLQAAARLAVLVGFVDIAAIGAIQFVVQGDLTHSATIATFTLGLFALIVASSSLVLRPSNVFLIAGVSTITEGWLLRSADIEYGVVGIAGIVLFSVAATTRAGTGRLSAVATSLAKTEIDRQMALLRGETLEQEKQQIETKLTDTRAQNDELIQLQAAKEALAQVLVHDLRSPLTGVIASLDTIRCELEEAGLRPDLQKSSGEALRQAERLTSMISDLLDVAKLEEGRLQPRRSRISAAELCEEVRSHALLIPRARRLAILAEAGPDLFLDADRNLLTRMVENLTTNAIRFAKTRVLVSAQREGNDLVFRVQNDGPPISQSLQGHLFEKFAQGGRTDGGWGLGLYFCKLAAEVHQGSVGVGASPDWNVTFEIRLPASVSSESTASSTSTSSLAA